MNVTGSDNRVMAPRRGILLQYQDRPTSVRRKTIALTGENALQTGMQVLHRHELRQVSGIEAPGIDDLLTMGIDDLDCLSLVQTNGTTASRRNDLEFCRHIHIPSHLVYRQMKSVLLDEAQGSSRIKTSLEFKRSWATVRGIYLP
tara:strand:- start:243 stop:677 length:435 start_codon:yes stop_codon:yes gene_type:complete